ncbi:MAG: Fatty acid hydroxylase-like protein [Labilithrix sp.]|nr:Fatty acid hydroxylase-like protein [Labilithrix sp.]
MIPERFLTPECIEAALGKPPRGIGIPVLKPLWLDRTIARAHPTFPAVFYGPIAAALLVWAYQPGGALALLGTFVTGMLAFTLVEYLLHRIIFHADFPDTREGKIREFLTHGYHHAYPIDPSRLVMPPMVSMPLGILSFLFTHFVLGGGTWDGAWSGFAVGYIGYDSLHYFWHHTKRNAGVAGWMKKYHHLHHHAPEPGRYGVSTPLWDVIFGTYKGTAVKRATR